MHGILGSKANWNTPSRKLLQEIGPKGWQILQLDHRAHGQSPAGEPPHDLAACASDVLETLAATGVDIARDELVVCGHSFGGKVALTVLQRLLEERAHVRATWLFDSVPGTPAQRSAEEDIREQSSGFVLGVVESVARQGTFADRAAPLRELEARGLSKPAALWIGQSIRNVPGGVELSYCVSTVRAMYDAYLSTCMWHVLESGRANVGVVVAGRNTKAWGAENLERLQASRASVVTLEAAGHNVHVDDLPGLLAAILPSFSS